MPSRRRHFGPYGLFVCLAAVAACGGGPSGTRQNDAGDAAGPDVSPPTGDAGADTRLDGGVDTQSSPPLDAPDDHGADAEHEVDAASSADADAASPRDAGDAAVEAADPCGPVTDARLFVDPIDGRDGADRSGAPACPFRTLKAAFAVVKASRATPRATTPKWTVEIVNTKGPTTLDVTTGELFPLYVPGGVAIEPVSATAPAPVISVSNSFLDGLIIQGPDWRLSHLSVVCNGDVLRGLSNNGGDGALDHVKISGCSHGFLSETGSVTVGPGFVSRGNRYGIKVQGGTMALVGGRGADRTDISGNMRMGVWLHGGGLGGPTTTLLVRGEDIDPAHPDDADVFVDDNMLGVYFDAGPEAMVARGLHATGNQTGIQVPEGEASISLRASNLSRSTSSAILVNTGVANVPSMILDFGADALTDPGKNLFSRPGQPAGASAQGTICAQAHNAGAPRIRAAGNLFGDVDCRSGGVLKTAITCGGQVDVAIPDLAAIDLRGCTTQ